MDRLSPAFVAGLGTPSRLAFKRLPSGSRHGVGVRMCTAAPAAASPAMALEIGARVRVCVPLIMYHYPGKKNTPVQVQGFEGFIQKNVSVTDGVQMSATAPYVVDFRETGHPKFRAHFEEHELEVIE